MEKKKKYILIIIILILCFSYLVVRSAQSSYESTISTTANSPLAGWNIKVNNVLATGGTSTPIDLTYTTNSNPNARPGKISPGSILNYPITLDTTGTGVAVKFSLDIVDKTINTDKLFTLTSISSSDITLIRTDVGQYTGVISKQMIGTNITINLTFEWVDTGAIEEYNPYTNNSSYTEITFNAIQYRGESITPYSG